MVIADLDCRHFCIFGGLALMNPFWVGLLGHGVAVIQVCWDTHLYHFPSPGQTWTSQNNGLEQAKHLGPTKSGTPGVRDMV